MPTSGRYLTITLTIVLAAWGRPAAAQNDIAGVWQQPGFNKIFLAPDSAGNESGVLTTSSVEDANERSSGALIGDYLGIPLNDEGRARALAYDPAILGVPEHVCMRHPAQYAYWGPTQLKISAQLDDNLDLVSYVIAGTFRRADRTIWMDGRPHPSKYAPHTWAGFTTGKWEGDTLVTTTTHLKWGWVRRNGVASSDQATVVTYYTRNDNILTIAWLVYDPLYLTEPYMKSIDLIIDTRVTPAVFGVAAADKGTGFFAECFPREEIARPDMHYTPFYLPGQNPFVGDRAKQLGIPAEATLGGADTAYPEYRQRLAR